MRVTGIFTVLVSMLLLVACEPVASVHPLYTQADLVTDARLPGCWQDEPDEGLCWFTITANGDRSYSLLLLEDDEVTQSRFRGYLAKLGEHLFLDIQPVRTENPYSIHAFHYASMHTFYRIELEDEGEGEVLRLAYLDDEWLARALDDGKVTLAHRRGDESRDHEVVLAAPTAELQKFVLRYAQDEEAFPPLDPLYLRATEAPPEELP